MRNKLKFLFLASTSLVVFLNAKESMSEPRATGNAGKLLRARFKNSLPEAVIYPISADGERFDPARVENVEQVVSEMDVDISHMLTIVANC